MKKIHGLFIIMQLLVVFVVVQGPLSNIVSAEEAVETKECDCYKDHAKHKDFHKYMRVHKDFYFELLTEKYAPESAEQWKMIRTERDLLMKKLSEAKKRGELLHGEVKSEEWKEQHHFLQKQLTKAVKERDEEKISTILPQIFTHYEELNKVFQQRVNSLSTAEPQVD
ncbi:hypothetical protein [Alkalihalophilus marmarensis]|uniref:hypothetical protein n=1 Tax=Alkalihalophilus marmarensis TaxID=521377 RepID=UPI002DB6AB85|nr:hypothetical protein [Alkalihalophilus marmarensis]MEC2073857.1 hypothetical protein [Alkalihalophilus marmarensis]